MPLWFWLMATFMAAGNGEFDIVSVLPATEYFKARDIDPTIEKLLELAGDKPSSGKKQIAQLLAIRQFAADRDSLTKSQELADVRKLLQQIAEGKKSNDSAGFASSYAKRALTALDGGKEQLANVGGWKEGANWMPKSVGFLAGLVTLGPKPSRQPLPDVTRLIPKKAKEQLFKEIDKLGNIRIDRIVIGLGELKDDKFEIFVRVTGKANFTWLLEAYKAGEVEELTETGGLKIRILRPPGANGEGPAIAFVGDSDFLLAGIESAKSRNLGAAGFVKAADVTTLNKMLALASKPGPDATQGPLKADLASIPANAIALAAGSFLSWMGKDTPFPRPQKVVAYAQRGERGIGLQVQAKMDGKEEAKKLVQLIEQGRNAALLKLSKLKDQPQPILGANVKAIIALLETIQLRSEGDNVHARLEISPDAMISMFVLGGSLVTER